MTKKNLVLGGILVVLVVLAYLYQGPLKEWRSSIDKSDNFLAQIDVDQIDKIEINSSNQEIALEKHDNKWKISETKEFYLKDELISSLNNGLKDATKAEVELASSNKDKKSDFQTDEENGTGVKLSQAGVLIAEFIVGKRGVDFTSTYISEPESDNTYIIEASISSLFNRTDWYDRTIFSSEKENISKIRFQYPNREFTVEKLDNDWSGTIPYKFSVDKDKIDKTLNIMSNLVATEIPEQNYKGTGLEKHSIIIEATGEVVNNILMIGGPKEAESDEEIELYYAKIGNSDNIYLITKEQRDELDKQIRDLQ